MTTEATEITEWEDRYPFREYCWADKLTFMLENDIDDNSFKKEIYQKKILSDY